MKTVVIKNYLDIDYMFEELLAILTEARNQVLEDYDVSEYPSECTDEALKEKADEMTMEFNEDMGKYLNSSDHKIEGNINNIDYDYPYHINGEVKYDTTLVQAMIDRLNNEEQSAQADEDRKFLVDWFFETFGTFGIEYNYREELVELLYHENDNEDEGDN